MQTLNEADTKAKLIDPALHSISWTEDLIHREETACGVDIIEGKPKRRLRGLEGRRAISVKNSWKSRGYYSGN